MKKYFLLIWFILMINQISYSQTKESINLDWKFTLNNPNDAFQKDFIDKDWRKLNLPHDWSIEGEFKESNPTGTSGAFLPGGIGWYRKEININNLEADTRYTIQFDGVYLNSEVWINGHYLGFHPNGYIGFEYELTPYLNKGRNVIAVKVDHSKLPSGRWYTGSGIYRNVWLKSSHKTYINENEVFISTTKIENNQALLNLTTQIDNELVKSQKVDVVIKIQDKEGKTVQSTQQSIKVSNHKVVTAELRIDNPQLWSPSTPYNYDLKIELVQKSKVINQYKTNFGVRSLEWIPNKGLFLNGESVLIKGLSNHQDAGAVGVAVPEQVLHKRLKLLKEMGCNALRTAHHPFSPEFYTMCDTMGFMVMDEAFDGWWKPKAKYDYGIYFDDYWERDLETFVKRDRNHPSVVIWSVGNEVPKFTPEEQEKLVNKLKEFDTTRPVTQGRGYIAQHIDIAGFNGHGELKNVLENYHKEHPEQLIIGTEITHTLQTRGIYRTKTWYRTKDNPAPWEKPEHFKKMEDKVYKIKDLAEEEVFENISPKYQSSYDNSIVRVGVRDDWNRVEALDYYVGNFRWTGFDYLGESFNWPARTANFGIIDLAGFPKDHYYLYQSLWSDKPMVHMLPHWNHEGKENVEIPVVVYTNCEEAELYLNDQSLGRKKMGSERQLVWKVPYQKGELKVVAYNEGEIKASKKVQTASSPYSMKVDVDKKRLNADRKDVLHCAISVVDEKGIFVPTANDSVTFSIEGAANIIGIENGDILDMSSPKNDFTRRFFNGKCLLLLQSNGEKGNVKIHLKSKTLKDKEIVIETNSI